MKRIVFTKVNTAELLDFEITDPGEKEVQVALAVSSISSGTEHAGITGSTTVSWNRPAADKPNFSCCHGMMAGFAAFVRGDAQNPWTPDYEPELYKTVLKACGAQQ